VGEARHVVKHPNRDLIALGIRQPWAELILRGIKTIEVRSSLTRVRGPIYLYSSKKLADIPAARKAIAEHEIDVDELPRGVLVGTIDIVDSRECRPADTTAACVPRDVLKGRFGWRLANPQRLETPLHVRFLPYGVWFYPFRRRNGAK
jgi:hypothetical protein